MSEQEAAVVETPDPKEALAAELDKIWEESQPEPEVETAEPEKTEAPEEAKPAEEPAPVIEAPTDLPQSVRDVWADLSDSARNAFQGAHRELSQKTANQGRTLAGLRPLAEVMDRATKEFAGLRDMSPEEAAQQVFDTAKTWQRIHEDPIGLMMEVAKQRGLEAQLAQALTGQVPEAASQVAALNDKIARLEAALSERPDIDSAVNNAITMRDTQRAVTEFAASAPHWAAVEPHMPIAIQMVQSALGENAPQGDVLRRAYDLAVSQFVPDAGTAESEAIEEVAAPDPGKAEAARKAKSVNVQSTPGDKDKKMSMRQAMELGYQNAQAL